MKILKNINNFFDKSPLYQVFIVNTLTIALFVYFLTFGLVDGNMPNPTRIINVLTISMSAMFGPVITFAMSQARKSSRFWEMADSVEKRINECNDPVILGGMMMQDIQTLYSLSQGLYHTTKIRELKRLANVKADTILSIHEMSKPVVDDVPEPECTVPKDVMEAILKLDPGAKFGPGGSMHTKLDYNALHDIICPG